MSNKAKASSFLSDLLDGEDELAQEIADAKAAKPDPDVQYIVYFKGDLPDTVWEYHHNPADGIPYGRLYGYWDEDKDAKVARHFVEHKSKNLKIMDYDAFMQNVVPNKDCTKVYDSEADFLLELI